MNDNGIWNQGSHRRLFYRKESAYQEWGLTLPAAKTGTGAEEKFTSYAAIATPYPAGAGVFSVPSVQLWLEQGGDLEAAIQFWGLGIYLEGTTDPDDGTGLDGDYYLNTDDMEYWGPKGNDTPGSWTNTGPASLPDPGSHDWLFGLGPPADDSGVDGDYYFDRRAHAYWGPKGDDTAASWIATGPHALPTPADALISDVVLQTLVTPQPTPVRYSIGTTANTPSANGWTDQTGTFYSDWGNLAVPIPAGAVYLFGLAAYMNANGITPEAVYPPYTHHATYALALQLGDVNGAVLATVEIATHHFQYDDPFETSQDIAAAFSSGQSISLASTATQKRARMIVSDNHYCFPYCRVEAGGYAERV